jgi:hypothetical protein
MKFILMTVDHNVVISHGDNKNNQKFLRGGLKNEVGKGRRVEEEKLRSSKTRSKASKPVFHENSNASYDFRQFTAFSSDLVQSKKPSVGPKGLIGPPCHGAPGRRRQKSLGEVKTL